MQDDVQTNWDQIPMTSHSGRRTFITGFAHKGVNVRVSAALAELRNISTTQRYIELNDLVLREAVELAS